MRRRLGACLLLLFAGPAAATQPPARPPDRASVDAQVKCAPGAGHVAYVPRLLVTEVNASRASREVVYLQRPCGALLARASDLKALRIRTEGKPSVQINHDAYLNLNDYDGLQFAIDESRQSIAIEGEPRIFYPTIIDYGPPKLPATSAPSPGAFLNYGALANGVQGGGEPNLNANATLGIFGAPGVLTSDWYWLRYAGVDTTRRIATTFTHDFEGQVSTLRLGDVFARGGSFGAGAPLGGVQYATNFALRPRINISPVQMMDAATRRTAVMDLSTSDPTDPARTSQAAFTSGATPVPYGPVELVNVPTYGNGEYQMSLRDPFGNVVRVAQPFFFNQGLLRPGLHDFSYEAGLMRRAFPEDDYRDGYGSGTHRYGFTDSFTGEVHGEGGAGTVALGVTGLESVPWVGVVNLTAAGSHSDSVEGTGAFGAAGIENRYQDYGYAMRSECRNDRFQLPLGAVAPNPTICRSYAQGTGRLPWGHGLSLSVSDTNQRSVPDVVAAIATYSLTSWRHSQLQISVGWERATTTAYYASLNFFLSFASARLSLPGDLFDSHRTSFNFVSNASSGTNPTAHGVLSTAAGPVDNAVGAQLASALDGRDDSSLTLGWAGSKLMTYGGYRHIDGIGAYSAGASSALTFIDGGLFTSLPVTSSFAVMRLGEDYAGVRVNGARTDADGDILINRLQPYYENLLNINSGDLPLNVHADRFQYVVRPRYRSGVVVRPSLSVLRDATFTVQVLDQQGRKVAMPTGAWAAVGDGTEMFPFGEDGLVYVTGLADRSDITVHYRDRQCRLTVTLPERAEVNATPDLGTFLCEGVQP